MRDLTRIWKWSFGIPSVLAAPALVALSDAPIATLAVILGAAISALLWVRSEQGGTRRRTRASAAHLSHELRTPLTSVLGIMDVLGDVRIPLDEAEREELVSLAHAEALHMSHVVSNLVASSRIARGLLHPELEPVDLATLVETALDRVPAVARRTFLTGHGAPAASADRALTLQIVLNLVQNVDRYARTGEVAIEVVPAAGSVDLFISDDGPGLDGSAFKGGTSEVGLGLGLPLSRDLARLMGGDLVAAPPRRQGATLRLTLPESKDVDRHERDPRTEPVVALSPRARLLVDMADALADRSLDRVVAGLQKQCSDMLRATSLALMVPDGDRLRDATSFGRDPNQTDTEPAPIRAAMESDQPILLGGLTTSHPGWATRLGCDAAMFVPVGYPPMGVLVIGWPEADDVPGDQGRTVAIAMAEFAAIALDRNALSSRAEFERELRSSVMESLPIAISVFAGDPPRVIDWNEAERAMLGLDDETKRPSDLDATQDLFDVRFADGTPLTVDNAPVTQAIRSGRSAGPFLLRVRRIDGSEVVTRTYCAPFADPEGRVVGAVVTSEQLDIAGVGTPNDDQDRLSA